MGCIQSKNGAVKKNPSDRALSQVKFKKVGIKDFDGVFTEADDPINKIANVNNSILQAQENVFDAVLATAGKYYTARLSPNPVNVIVYEVTEKKEVELSADDIAAHEALSKPYSVLAEAIAAFNTANSSSEEALEVQVVNNRLSVKDTDMVKSASYVNNALFLLRKAARKAAGKEAMGFKDVLKEALVVIKKGGSKPEIKPNMKKLKQGEIDFDVKLGKTGPTGQVQKLWDAIAGKKGLLESMKKGASSSTALEGEVDGVKTKVDALPKSVSGIMEKAKEAEMGPMQMAKAVKTMAANASKFSSASTYIPMLMETLKTIAADLEDVFKATPDATGEDKAESTDADEKKVEAPVADADAVEAPKTADPVAEETTDVEAAVAVEPVVDAAVEPVVEAADVAAVEPVVEAAADVAAVETEDAAPVPIETVAEVEGAAAADAQEEVAEAAKETETKTKTRFSVRNMFKKKSKTSNSSETEEETAAEVNVDPVVQVAAAEAAVVEVVADVAPVVEVAAEEPVVEVAAVKAVVDVAADVADVETEGAAVAADAVTEVAEEKSIAVE